MFWVWQVLKSIDQFFNALFGGYSDETISLRAARARNEGQKWGCVLCKIIDKVVSNHCTATVESARESIIERGLDK